MAKVLGETKTRFYNGVCYRFQRVDKGVWACTSHEYWLVPGSIKDEIEKEWD